MVPSEAYRHWRGLLDRGMVQVYRKGMDVPACFRSTVPRKNLVSLLGARCIFLIIVGVVLSGKVGADMKLTVNPELQKKQGKLVSGVQLKEMDFFDTEDKKKKFCQMMEGMSDEIFENTQSNPDNFVVAQDQETADAVEKAIFKKHLPSLKKTYLEGVWDQHDPTELLVTITDYNRMFAALTCATLNYVEHHQCVKIKDFMHSTAKEVALTIDEVVADNIDPSCCGTFERGLLVSAVMCRATDSPNWMEEWRNFLQALSPNGHKHTLKESKQSLETLEPVQPYQKITVLGASKMVDITVTVERIHNMLLPTIGGNAFTRQYRVTANVSSTVGLNDVKQAVRDRFAELLTWGGVVAYHDIVFNLHHEPTKIKKALNKQYVKDINKSLYAKGTVVEVGTNQPVPCSPPDHAEVDKPVEKQTEMNITVDQINGEIQKKLEKFVGQKNTSATQHEIEKTLAAYSEADAAVTAKMHEQIFNAVKIPQAMLGYPPTKAD